MQVRAGVASSAAARLKQRLGDRADHPRRALLLVLGDARVDALRGERHEHVLAGPQPARSQRLDEQLARGPDVAWSR